MNSALQYNERNGNGRSIWQASGTDNRRYRSSVYRTGFCTSLQTSQRGYYIITIRRHIGHYKAALQNDILVAVHTDMTNFAFTHGCPPQRWMRASKIPIDKTPGRPLIDKLERARDTQMFNYYLLRDKCHIKLDSV